MPHSKRREKPLGGGWERSVPPSLLPAPADHVPPMVLPNPLTQGSSPCITMSPCCPPLLLHERPRLVQPSGVGAMGGGEPAGMAPRGAVTSLGAPQPLLFSAPAWLRPRTLDLHSPAWACVSLWELWSVRGCWVKPEIMSWHQSAVNEPPGRLWSCCWSDARQMLLALKAGVLLSFGHGSWHAQGGTDAPTRWGIRWPQ